MRFGETTIDIVRELREGSELQGLARKLARLDDVQIAAQLDNVSGVELDRLFELLPAERQVHVFESIRYETAAEMVTRLAPERAAGLLAELESDDIVDILGAVAPEMRGKILARFEPDEAETIAELLTYDDDCAGGIMSLDFIAVASDSTVGDALRSIQEAEDPPAHAFYVYAVDEGRRLVGVLSLRRLVTSKPPQLVREVMYADIVSVTPETDQEQVAELASRYDLVAVPVVDKQRHLVGIVTIDDIVDVLREEATEDILMMAGAGQMLVETRSFWPSFRTRVPWLLYAAMGGVLVAALLSGYEGTLLQVPELALFMPVVAGMGGNVGTQSSTIVVRGLAVGYVETVTLTRVIARETLLGATLGAVYGTLMAIAAPLVTGMEASAWQLAGVVSLGMVGSMTIAATVGAGIPLVMDRYGIDPAVSTGPFVTTAVDGLGLLFYFWLATQLFDIAV